MIIFLFCLVPKRILVFHEKRYVYNNSLKMEIEKTQSYDYSPGV